MKEIVIGIDFSKGAMNALNYAILIANHLEANISMVWVDKPLAPDSVYDNSPDSYREEVHKRFAEIKKEFGKKLKKRKLDYKIRSGKVYEEITNHAKQNNASFVVSGTHGISGFEELWIGSNANRIVSYAPCPVFTLRQNFSIKKRIEKIILPIDSSSDTRQKVAYAIEIAKAFGSKVHILALYTSSISAIKSRVEKSAAHVIEQFKINKVDSLLKKVKASNVTSETLKYAEENDGDLIVIMTEQESSSSSILLGPYAQQMVNHSPIPVLSVHPKSFYKDH